MNLLLTIKNSIYNPDFYKQVPKKSFGSALVYFLLLILAITILHVIFLVKPLFIDAKIEVSNIITKAVEYFPKDLSVSVKNGKVVTNVVEPYLVPFPDQNGNKFRNLLVIDTKTPYSVDQFNSYFTVAWLTSDTLFIRRNQGEIRAYDITKAENITIDRNFIDSIVMKIKPFLNILGPVLLLFASVGLFLFFLLKLVQLLVIALFILILGKFLKTHFSYGEAYKIGLYAMTFGLIIEFLISKTFPYTGVHGFPFQFTLVTLVVVAFNYYSSSSKATSSRKK